ncbi:factor for adipocyte protein [Neofusicoccum parvum]|nr:factor for adipocyte protein [Neofusicoccum parvum]
MALGWDDERTMCCAICGGPIRADDTATLLSDPARELEHVEEHYATKWGRCKFTTDLDIDACTATNAGGAFFVIRDDGRRATACAPSDRYYIPAHGSCLHLADRVLRSHHGHMASMRQLWKVLRMRCLASVADGRPEPLARVGAPDNYCLPHGVAGQEWEGGDDHWVG